MTTVFPFYSIEFFKNNSRGFSEHYTNFGYYIVKMRKHRFRKPKILRFSQYNLDVKINVYSCLDQINNSNLSIIVSLKICAQ